MRDGNSGGHGYKLLLLGDFLPVVHEDRLEWVRDKESHRWSPDKIVLLGPGVSVNSGIATAFAKL